MRLLLIESDVPAAQKLGDALRRGGHIVDAFRGCREAILALRVIAYDLLLFDLGGPSTEALALLRNLRQRDDHTPAVVIHAGNSMTDRVRLLDLGADDCLSRPFAQSELEARMRAVLRRAVVRVGDNVIGVGRLHFDLAERSARIGDDRLSMSPREIDVLETLLLRRGRVVSKAQIRGRLCDWSGDLTDGAIELYVHRLRRRLAGSGTRLYTVRGFGYVLQQVGALG